MTVPELEEFFDRLRFDPAHHLGAGDIRLTLGQQQEIVKALFVRPEVRAFSAGGAYELKLSGTPGYVGTIAGITVHADPEVPEHTVVVKDELGRELASRERKP